MKRILLSVLITLFVFTVAGAKLRVGDPGVIVDSSKFDSDYPQMERWANAGVRGGIPFTDSFDKTASMNPGNSAAINAAITSLSKLLQTGQRGLLTLKNGTYTIDAAVNMKSNVSLIGESRDGVLCSITMSSSEAFSFNNVHYCGLYNLTIKGSWSEPKYLWNYSLDANREFSNDNISVKMKSGTTDCWLDKVTLLNSANDPMRCPANHNTFRDLIVDGCKRKAGGAEGYFFIQGGDNLVTACQITHLRHISLQGGNVEYNVVYDNDFRQEVSFHSGDNGNNLIANNRITLPVDMPPVDPGDADDLTPVEARNGKPTYFAVMGPWSIQHQNSSHPNFLFRNKCVQNNHNIGPRTPWSDDSKVYYGPKTLGLSNQQRIDNFPEYEAGLPSGGVLYAVYLGEAVAATGITLSKENLAIRVNEEAMLSAVVLPDSATNQTILWNSSNTDIATVQDGKVVGISEGSCSIIAKTEDGNFLDSCALTVSGVLKIAVTGVSLVNTEVVIMPNQEFSLSYEVMPKNAFNKSVVWSSSDTNLVVVDADGRARAKAIGSTRLTVTTVDGGFTAICVVTVSNELTYTETFSNLKLDGWGTETFVGDKGHTWNVNGKGISGDIAGKGVYFQGDQIGITSGKIAGGINSFSVECIDKWNDGVQRKVELLINDKVVGSRTHTGSAKYTFTVNNIAIEGEFVLSVRNASGTVEGNNTVSFDNISWTSYSGVTSAATISKDVISVFPNPFTQQLNLSFASTQFTNIRLIDVSGRVVVSQNLEASRDYIMSPSYTTVPKGVYFLELFGASPQTIKVIRN